MVQQFIDQFEKGRILVVGDVILDRYTWGEVGRISPEAPVPILRVRGRSEVAGGAGNVAASLAGLGCGVTLVGTVGADQGGDHLRAIL